MSMSQPYLLELAHEMDGVRRTLERVPEEHLDWKPHERSMSFRGLVTHLANLPRWGWVTVEEDEYDVAPGGEPQREDPVASLAAGLEAFDENLKRFVQGMESASDEHLMTPWTLRSNGEALFAIPRIAALRGMVLNHAIHHRGQLTVYLRLRDVPLPALYGPSADEVG